MNHINYLCDERFTDESEDLDMDDLQEGISLNVEFTPNDTYASNNEIYSDSEDNTYRYNQSTEHVTNIPHERYHLCVKFMDQHLPKDYVRDKYNFEGSYYLRNLNDGKLPYDDNLKQMMADILQNSAEYHDTGEEQFSIIHGINDEILIGDIYLRRPNIEKEITELDDGEYIVMIFVSNNENIPENSILYCGLYTYNKSENKVVPIYLNADTINTAPENFTSAQIPYLIDAFPEEHDNGRYRFMLEYKGDDGDLKETHVKFISNNYSRFSLPLPYNYSSKNELEFSRDPMYNNNDRRDNKLIKYNRFYNDYKTKENYFYMKQYLERLSNIHDLDDITCLEEFKRRMDLMFF